MESIKFGTTSYELVSNGYQLSDNGGKIVFIPGNKAFTDVEGELKACKDIMMMDNTGEPILTRADLVYAGRLAKDDNYIIGADTEAGTDVTGTVLIAEFRVPDLREQVAELQAKVKEQSETIDMMLVADLEV